MGHPSIRSTGTWGSNSAWSASELCNRYPLHRQKAFLVPSVVPPDRLARLESVATWDDWDPNRDRWYFDRQDASDSGRGPERGRLSGP